MSRSAGSAVENNFSRALITEATATNSQDNSVSETFDCRFNRLGNVSRRLGYDYELDYSTRNIARSNSYIRAYLWEGADDEGEITLGVVQIGTSLDFFKRINNQALSGGYIGSVSLEDFRVAGSIPTNLEFADFATGYGALFVVHPSCEPFYIVYDKNTDALTPTQITVETRDLEGVEDTTFDIEYRQPINLAAATDIYKYNMYNQGWYEYAISDGGGNTERQVLERWDEKRDDLPSYCDVWWLYKNANEDFHPEYLPDQFAVGNTPAPKGHYIYNAFQSDRANTTSFNVPERSSNNHRPSTVAFYASRVFYAGVQADGYSTKIFFSQIASDLTKVGKCYQRSDPTSEITYELLPNDGGYIDIPDVGRIIKMEVVGNWLIVFSTNGIWTISGTDLTAFKADDYSVEKLPQKISCDSKNSFVDAMGTIIFWAEKNIYAVTLGDQQIPAVSDLGTPTIKTFIENIPVGNLKYVQGAYNADSKIVQWLYKQAEADGTVDDNFDYDRMLNFDTVTGAFYPWTIPVEDNAPLIHTLLSIEGTTTTAVDDAITDNSGVAVTVESDDTLSEEFNIRVSAGREFLYLTSIVTTEPIVEAEDFTIQEYTFDAAGAPATSFTQAFDFDDIYKIVISFHDLTFDANDRPTLLFSSDGGVTFPGTASEYTYANAAAGGNRVNSTEATQVILTNRIGLRFGGHVDVMDVNNSNATIFGTSNVYFRDDVSGETMWESYFKRNVVGAVNAIKIEGTEGATMDDGYVHICVYRAGREQTGGGTSSVYTWATETNPLFKDWEEQLGANAIDYTSFFLTNHKIHGDINRKSQVETLDIVSLRDADSGGYVQTRFDWSNSGSSGKWSRFEKIYLDKTNRDFVRRRVRLRGHGHSFQFYVKSETTKPFNIHGWSARETVSDQTN